ncbi:phosphate ABC transporter substrate-binding protein, PhoT family (TC 3.A.1.7.1) [Thermosyntropha lipolytica DSM 11003]|uniref:Phosphate-binding protein n=1 Tax=Thermosyntropha lipolytica DSM 11003 TaxID=1123382 RepID=A0A1M5K745_9FIRM|nr:phosphate ABC transporter substrate-binding protein [Thermosyntropha lipolytica]SHG48329.1 phosphate ABC transporter substrate-binding protein, PhoT family (TC 3.A.1.7.1) [Thermosyntropha lipolytica DSM 11003]
MRGRKKWMVLVVLSMFMVSALLIGGCGKKEEGDKAGDEAGLTGTITIAGSTSVQPFSEVLAEKFMQDNPRVQINVQGGGSSQGITAAVSGAADIGASSRELKAEEKGQGLVETVIAYDGIAIIVNPANKIDNLTREQIRDIYLGNITNWKEVGGEDAPITVVCREAGSGTRGAFEEIVMEKQDISNKVIIQNSTGAVASAVAGDKNAIGFVSLHALNDKVKAVKVDGVEAKEENIKNGSYKISRPFIYLTKGEPTGVVKAFIDFVLSEEGQKIMQDEGAVPVK